MGAMSASDAAPLPRLGEVFFDVRGNSRSMRLSWYADTGVAVLSIWQGGMCTGTFRLAIDDLPRMVETLQRGPDGQRAQPPAAHRPGVDDPLEAPAMGPLPGGGLPDYDLARTAYQPGPAVPAGAGRHSAPAARHSEPPDYLPGTGQYEAHPPTPRPYLTGSVREASLPDQPAPPERPRHADRTGSAPLLAGPDSYRAEPPRPRAEYPPDLPGPGPEAGYPPPLPPSPRAANPRAANHGAADPDRYPDDPYGTGLMDYQDEPEPAYYPPGTSAPAHREAGGRSDTDYQAHYGGAVTDDIAPPPRRETSPYSRPPGNRRA